MLLSVSLTVLLLQDLPTSVGVRFQAPLDVSELPKPHFSSPKSFGSVAAAACFSNSVYSQCFKSFTSTPQMSMPQYNISGRLATLEISGASLSSQLLRSKVTPSQELESNKCTVIVITKMLDMNGWKDSVQEMRDLILNIAVDRSFKGSEDRNHNCTGCGCWYVQFCMLNILD